MLTTEQKNVCLHIIYTIHEYIYTHIYAYVFMHETEKESVVRPKKKLEKIHISNENWGRNFFKKNREYVKKNKTRWARWFTHVNLALWEAKAGRSQGQEFKTSLVDMVNPCLY